MSCLLQNTSAYAFVYFCTSVVRNGKILISNMALKWGYMANEMVTISDTERV